MSIEWSIDISGPCVTTCCCSVNPLSGRRGKGNEDEANPVGVIFSLAYLGGLSFFSFFILFFLFLFSSESCLWKNATVGPCFLREWVAATVGFCSNTCP